MHQTAQGKRDSCKNGQKKVVDFDMMMENLRINLLYAPLFVKWWMINGFLTLNFTAKSSGQT
ncbi:hypothetical protein D7V94_20490 [Parablautia intestinalis]|uniref:Uncharacterized protein n=1 Tax=Parablautia intestinalis TaxID=2320100 RepID=A0A3A9A8I1_9FIRM|nr:hypothetical protein D7V94_20490 [Parablautia intestinalis]